MAVTVWISAILRTFAGRLKEVELEGSTVEEVLKQLVRTYPDMEKILFDETGDIRSFVNVYPESVKLISPYSRLEHIK